MDTPDQRCLKGRFRVRPQGKEIVHALVTGIYVMPVGLISRVPRCTCTLFVVRADHCYRWKGLWHQLCYVIMWSLAWL